MGSRITNHMFCHLCVCFIFVLFAHDAAYSVILARRPAHASLTLYVLEFNHSFAPADIVQSIVSAQSIVSVLNQDVVVDLAYPAT